MNILPTMENQDGISKRQQMEFGGYNHNISARDGEIWDMKNMTSDYYPLLSPRKKRYKQGHIENANGFFAGDGLFWVDGTDFYADDEVKGSVTDSEKTIISLGRYVLVFPDKMYYKRATDEDEEEFGSLELTETRSCRFVNGTYAGQPAEQNTIETNGEAFNFKVGDAVEIEGSSKEENNRTIVIQEISEDKKSLRFYEYSFTNNNSYEEITISRKVPDMDFFCESENRLWGCKGDSIYGSKLGDPFNRNVFAGLSTDSYFVEVGSAGDFTGAHSYMGYPIFFKEENIYKLHGSKPSNYQLITSASLGVEKGSHKSLAIAGEKLFYLSRVGVMLYGGGIPQDISLPLGDEQYKLSPEERRTFQEERGELTYVTMQAAMNSTTEEKGRILEDIVKFADDMAKRGYAEDNGIDYTSTTWDKTIDALTDGVDFATIRRFSMEPEGLSKDTEKRQVLLEMDIPEEQKRVLYETRLDSEGHHTDRIDSLMESGVSFDEYWEIENKDSSRRIDEFIEAGIDLDSSKALSEVLSSLKPFDGAESVSKSQKYIVIAEANVSDEEKIKAITSFMDENERSALTSALDAGIPLDIFIDYKADTSDITSDKDSAGKTISGSKHEKILTYIDSLDIGEEEKDFLYFQNGYAESTLGKAPWRSGARYAGDVPQQGSYRRRGGESRTGGGTAGKANKTLSLARSMSGNGRTLSKEISTSKYGAGITLPKRRGEEVVLPTSRRLSSATAANKKLSAGSKALTSSVPAMQKLISANLGRR